MPELKKVFLDEAEELLLQIEPLVLELERGSSPSLLEELFRAVHTMKGSAGVAGIAGIAALSHRLEDLLQKMRAGELKAGAGMVDLLLKAVDCIKDLVEKVAGGGDPEPPEGLLEEISFFARVNSRGHQGREDVIFPGRKSFSALDQKTPYFAKLLRQQEKALKLADGEVLPGLLPTVRRILEGLAEQRGLAAEREEKAAGIEEERELLLKMTSRLLSDLDSNLHTPLDLHTPLEDPLPAQESLPSTAAGEATSPLKAEEDVVQLFSEKSSQQGKKQSSFRIQQETASALMNLAGQLVIAKNSLPYLVKELEEMGLKDKARELKARYLSFDRLAQELQDKVMDIWLLPIQEVFGRFPRFVRETTKKLNKKVELLISGSDTRLDRNIVEVIYEPLLHLVRNALDHGIEEIEERQMAGKSPTGVIHLAAQRQGERVLVTVSDDGRGIDVEKLAEKALSCGVVSPEQLASMSEKEKLRLIFIPGLSTREGASDLSGRGVGMDAVEKTVKSLGGMVQLQSAPGKGTTFVLNLPFTMATSEVLMVQVGGGFFGIPLSSIRETVRVQEEKIKNVHGRPFVLLRGEIIPLLKNRLFLECGSSAWKEKVLVVLRQNSALLVDAVVAKETVIVKPLKGELQRLPYLMGAAVLGNGRVLLVLNPHALVELTFEGEEEIYAASISKKGLKK